MSVGGQRSQTNTLRKCDMSHLVRFQAGRAATTSSTAVVIDTGGQHAPTAPTANNSSSSTTATTTTTATATIATTTTTTSNKIHTNPATPTQHGVGCEKCGWLFAKGGKWHNFTETDADLMEQKYMGWKNSKQNADRGSWQIVDRGTIWIDFDAMTQLTWIKIRVPDSENVTDVSNAVVKAETSNEAELTVKDLQMSMREIQVSTKEAHLAEVEKSVADRLQLLEKKEDGMAAREQEYTTRLEGLAEKVQATQRTLQELEAQEAAFRLLLRGICKLKSCGPNINCSDAFGSAPTIDVLDRCHFSDGGSVCSHISDEAPSISCTSTHGEIQCGSRILGPKTLLFEDIESLFRKSVARHRMTYHNPELCDPANFHVIEIKKLHDPLLLRQYQSECQAMLQRTGHVDRCNVGARMCKDSVLNEYFLWHGCASNVAASIAQHGFDPQRGGEGAGKMFGIGTYFAEHSSKSAYYSEKTTQKTYCMILARVLLGQAYWTQETMTKAHRPPDGHDSVIACTRSEGGCVDHREYIIYKKAQAIPMFKVSYIHTKSCRCHLCSR
ncbi:unnamed protein product [Polarella glacialis]|uniref:Poly [ADP-ribose] polymerase n=1 Tax=Polarella glacialis TaxID=89957 RepID=A0A813J0X2_POLGL|nr:unnamed protein product [Polarella glacialis]